MERKFEIAVGAFIEKARKKKVVRIMRWTCAISLVIAFLSVCCYFLGEIEISVREFMPVRVAMGDVPLFVALVLVVLAAVSFLMTSFSKKLSWFLSDDYPSTESIRTYVFERMGSIAGELESLSLRKEQMLKEFDELRTNLESELSVLSGLKGSL